MCLRLVVLLMWWNQITALSSCLPAPAASALLLGSPVAAGALLLLAPPPGAASAGAASTSCCTLSCKLLTAMSRHSPPLASSAHDLATASRLSWTSLQQAAGRSTPRHREVKGPGEARAAASTRGSPGGSTLHRQIRSLLGVEGGQLESQGHGASVQPRCGQAASGCRPMSTARHVCAPGGVSRAAAC
jgi:hypothetical protein